MIWSCESKRYLIITTMPEALVRNHRKKVVKEEVAEEGIKPGTVVTNIFDPKPRRSSSRKACRSWTLRMNCIVSTKKTKRWLSTPDIRWFPHEWCAGGHQEGGGDVDFGWMNTSIIPWWVLHLINIPSTSRSFKIPMMTMESKPLRKPSVGWSFPRD